MAITRDELEQFIEDLQHYADENMSHEMYLSRPVVFKLIGAFAAYLDGEAPSLDHAFGFVRPKHRAKSIDRERLLVLADAYQLQRRSPELSWAAIWEEMDEECEASQIKDGDHLRKLVTKTYKSEVEHFVEIELASSLLARRVEKLAHQRSEAKRLADREKFETMLSQSRQRNSTQS